jgi:hypothetical protein
MARCTRICRNSNGDGGCNMNNEQVMALVAYAKQMGAPEDALDDLVQDAAQESRLPELNALADPADQEWHIEATEAMASGVNNGGLEEQLRYLLEEEVSPERIREALSGQPKTRKETDDERAV